MTDQLEKLRETLAAVTPWEGLPGAIHGGERVLEILNAAPEHSRPTRLGCALLGYRSRDAELAAKDAEIAELKERLDVMIRSNAGHMDAIEDLAPKAKQAYSDVAELVEALELADEGIQRGQATRSSGEFTQWRHEVQKFRPQAALLAKHGKEAK